MKFDYADHVFIQLKVCLNCLCNDRWTFNHLVNTWQFRGAERHGNWHWVFLINFPIAKLVHFFHIFCCSICRYTKFYIRRPQCTDGGVFASTICEIHQWMVFTDNYKMCWILHNVNDNRLGYRNVFVYILITWIPSFMGMGVIIEVQWLIACVSWKQQQREWILTVQDHPQKTRFTGPRWGLPGSCRLHVGPMLVP